MVRSCWLKRQPCLSSADCVNFFLFGRSKQDELFSCRSANSESLQISKIQIHFKDTMVYTRGFATTKIIVINFFFFYPPITLAMSKAVQLFLSRILTSAPDFMRSLATALNLKQEVTKLSKCRPHTLSYITQSRLLILSVSLFRDVIFKL